MTIEFNDVLNLTDDIQVRQKFWESFPEGDIKLLMDDRPEVSLNDGTSVHFFLDAKKRYQVLADILGFNFEDQLESLVAFVNGETDELINYHFNLYPIKTEFTFKKFGAISLTQLSDATFEQFVEAYFPTFPGQLQSFPAEYRLLVITEVKATRLSHDYDHHLFFDKLHDINRTHRILIHCLQHFSGTYHRYSGSIASDSFPNAGACWASKRYKFALSPLTESDFNNVEAIMNSLQPNIFYRLLIGTEINSSSFASLVFLRSILDPFLKFNDAMIVKARNRSHEDKTEIQARLIFKSLTDNNARFTSDLTLSEFTKFLKIRNAIAHPSPAEDLSTHHILHDKEILFRKIVYEFVFKTFLHNIANGTDLFTASTNL